MKKRRHPVLSFLTPIAWVHPIGMLKATATNLADWDRTPDCLARWWFAHTPDDWRNYFY